MDPILDQYVLSIEGIGIRTDRETSIDSRFGLRRAGFEYAVVLFKLSMESLKREKMRLMLESAKKMVYIYGGQIGVFAKCLPA